MSKKKIHRRYQTFFPRFWAGIIDTLIAIPFFIAITLLWEASTSTLVAVLCFAIVTFAYAAYSILMHGYYGQTLGKRAMKIRVLSVDDEPASMRQALLRDCVWLALAIIGFFLDLPEVLGGEYLTTLNEETSLLEDIIAHGTSAWLVLEMITMLFNDKRRAIHDLIAGTVVVRD